MIIHEVKQGSPEWHALRANTRNASEAPAMMGVSPYKSRSALVREKATGITEEITPDMQRRFDLGHMTEALVFVRHDDRGAGVGDGLVRGGLLRPFP
jgi:predicted phage-related endonuclease